MTSRGEILNNPMDVRVSAAPWKGKLTPSRDPAFETFDSPINGIRAGARIFIIYYRLHGLSTVEDLITRWAPTADRNPTTAYIAFVSECMAVGPRDKINLLDPIVLGKLVTAVITDEAGENIYTPQDITTAIQDALL